MDFSSLILMEKDKETGFISKELGSFSVDLGAEHIKSFYVKDNQIFIKFDTNKDVEEWEYSAIYDLFNYELFKEEGFNVEDDEEQFNPTFLLSFDYKDDNDYIAENLGLAIELIVESMDKVFSDISEKSEEYK